MNNTLLRYVIIPHFEHPAALLLPTQAGWTLPFVDLPGHIYTMTGAINRAIREQLGAEITILRWVYRHQSPPGQPADRVYAADNHSPHWAPPTGARWISRNELADLELAVPEHRAVLDTWLAETALPEPPLNRAPWARPGWFRDASAWIVAELGRAGLTATGPVEQIKAWSIACLLRADTDQGAVYFKACSALLPAEIGVTMLLAREFPMHAPAAVAVDYERRWLLTREFSGPLLDEIPALSQWEAAVRLYARMQIAMIPKTRLLLEAGCPDRSLPVIAADMDRLLANTDLLQGSDRMSPAELDQLRGMAPELGSLLLELERLGPPPTLEHGDLHPKNIALDGERVLIFDWSDASVSHPFFGLVNLLDSLRGTILPQTDQVRERLKQAYLEPWEERWPAEQLQAALHIADRIHKVHVATFVERYVLRGAETKEEWLSMPAYFLKKLLPTP